MTTVACEIQKIIHAIILALFWSVSLPVREGRERVWVLCASSHVMMHRVPRYIDRSLLLYK